LPYCSYTRARARERSYYAYARVLAYA